MTMSEKILYEPPVSKEILLQVEGVLCESTQVDNWGTSVATVGEVTETDVLDFFNF